MRVAKGAELSTAAVGACDEPTDAVGNSGRTGDFILRGQLPLRQVGEVPFVGRRALQAGMTAMCVVPGQVIGNVGASCADAVVGLQVHPLVLQAAPQALDEDVVSPGVSAGVILTHWGCGKKLGLV